MADLNNSILDNNPRAWSIWDSNPQWFPGPYSKINNSLAFGNVSVSEYGRPLGNTLVVEATLGIGSKYGDPRGFVVHNGVNFTVTTLTSQNGTTFSVKQSAGGRLAIDVPGIVTVEMSLTIDEETVTVEVNGSIRSYGIDALCEALQQELERAGVPAEYAERIADGIKNGTIETFKTLEEIVKKRIKDTLAPGIIEDTLAPGINCFPAHTPIATSSTTTKPISDIRIGDTVLAFDPAADLGRGGLVPRKVVRLFRNTTEAWVRLTWVEGGALKELVATPGHRFLDRFGGFPTIQNMLEDGKATVVLASGALTEVTAERITYTAETAHLFEQAQVQGLIAGNAALKPAMIDGWQTYNFEVEGLHTYVAGGVRVHNDSFSETSDRLFGRDMEWVAAGNPWYDFNKNGKADNGEVFAGESFVKDVETLGESFVRDVEALVDKILPVILDLDGDGIEISVSRTVSFDWDGDGFLEGSSWVGADDGFLVVDLDGDGAITKGEEIAFADRTAATDTDLQALGRLYDVNGDGKLSAIEIAAAGPNIWRDANKNGVRDTGEISVTGLQIWQDADQDGVSDAGELKTLAAFGISEIRLTYDDGAGFGDTGDDVTVYGNTLHGLASMVRNGATVIGGVGDVSLSFDALGWREVLDANGNRKAIEFENGPQLTYRTLTTDDAVNLVVEGLDGATGNARDNLLQGAGALKSLAISGAAGADTLTGGWADDMLAGDAGADMIYGGAGHDLLVIDAHDASVFGGQGYDTVLVTSILNGAGVTVAGGVTLDLEAGLVEAAVGGDWGDQFFVSALFGVSVEMEGGSGNDRLTGGASDDMLSGGDNADVLTGNGGDDYGFGGTGVDSLFGGIGSDYLEGGDAVDTLDAQGGDDVVIGGEGADSLNGGAGDDFLEGGGQDDTVKGGSGDDVVDGGTENDSLLGEDGDDRIYGGAGNDTIAAGTGDDLVYGGAGNDTFRAAHADGKDVVFGGAGVDVLRLTGVADEYFLNHLGERTSARENDVLVSIGTDWTEYNVRKYSDPDFFLHIKDIEEVRFTGSTGYWKLETAATVDQLRGSFDYHSFLDLDQSYTAAAESVSGGNGQDSLAGGGGNDTVIGGAGRDSVGGDGGADSLAGGSGTDLVTGGDGNDTLVGDSGSDDLIGDAGNDTLTGGSGADVIVGGAGNDSANGLEGSDVLYGGDGLDKLNGGEADDLVDGDAGNDRLTGGDGADRLSGGDGADSITGDLGDDRIAGDDGYGTVLDLYMLERLLGATTWSGTGAPTVGLDRASHDDLLARIEAGSTTVQRLVNEAIDGLRALSDSEFVRKLLKNAYGTAPSEADVAAWTARVAKGVDQDLSRVGVFHAIAGSTAVEDIHVRAALIWTGSYAASNGPMPRWFADVIDGGFGNDEIAGGFGNDTLKGGHGFDQMFGGLQNDTLDGGTEDDALHGGAGFDRLFGGTGADVLDGGEGADLLQGDVDAITMDNPFDMASYAGSSEAVTIDLGTNTNSGGDATGDQLFGIEWLHGSAWDDRLVGDVNANQLFGARGADLLAGGAGDDVLHGGTGSDRLFGNEGDDDLSGGENTDSLHGGSGLDRFMLDAGSGNDTIADFVIGEDRIFLEDADNEISLVTRGAVADIYYGNGDSVRLLGVTVANLLAAERTAVGFTESMVFREFAGGPTNDNETITGTKGHDVLVGGIGADLLRGDEGRDTAAYGDSTTAVTVDLLAGQVASGGTAEGDRFESIECVTGSAFGDALLGDAGENGVAGGEGNDLLSGRQGDDRLSGGIGNDRLIGGVGNDELFGGAGADTFDFAANQGIDHILDFENGLDKIRLIGLGWTDLQLIETENGTGSIVSFGPGNRILLHGVSTSGIDQADFEFL